MKSHIARLLNAIRNILLFKLRYRWVIYGKDVHVQWSTHIWSPHKLVHLGNHVGIGRYCDISTDLFVGNHVLIASAVAFLARDAHTPSVLGTTMFDAPRGDKYRIVIEDDVWIGYGAIILSGVRVGRGSVVGAGAIITKDLPPYSVTVSQPSEVIRGRFTQDEIQVHEAALRCQHVIDDSLPGEQA